MPYTKLLGQAFCALLENYPGDRLPRHGGTATTLNLTIDLDDLQRRTGHAVTAGGEDVSVEEMLRQACNGELIPAVFDGVGLPLHLGRTRRLFSPAQRKAMALRDRECRAEGCTMPAAWCEAHHKSAAWVDGGCTDVEDGILLCPWHHHRAHDAAYRVKYLPNGDVRYRRRT